MAAAAAAAARRRRGGRKVEDEKEHCGFEIDKVLGKGAFGEVVETVNPNTKRPMALKISHESVPREQRGRGLVPEPLMEAMLGVSLHHPYITRVEYAAVDCKRTQQALIGFEPAQSTLKSALKLVKDEKSSIDTKIQWLAQIACALSYLHDNRIVHFDLKPANILIFEEKKTRGKESKTSESVAKVADLGLAERLLNGSRTYIPGGTTLWNSPEKLCNPPYYRSYAAGADIWAYGMIAFETLFGFHPFSDTPDAEDSNLTERDVLARTIAILGPPPKSWLQRYTGCAEPIQEAVVEAKTLGNRGEIPVREEKQSLLSSLLRDRYSEAKRVYGAPTLQALERLFERIFQWNPESRRIDLTEVLGQRDRMDLATCPSTAPAFDLHERKAPWLEVLKDALPPDLFRLAALIWERLKCVDSSVASESHPSLLDMLAILSLIAKVGMYSDDRAFFERILADGKKKRPTYAAIYQRQNDILERLGFNLDAFPSPCKKAGGESKKKKPKTPRVSTPPPPSRRPSPAKPTRRKQPAAARRREPREPVNPKAASLDKEAFCAQYRRDPNIDLSTLRWEGRRVTRALLRSLCPP